MAHQHEAYIALGVNLLSTPSMGVQGTVLWRARGPAESMAWLLQDGVIERSWIGGHMFGTAFLVNSKTREGAWVGATHKVTP
jgi:hypothetical protein